MTLLNIEMLYSDMIHFYLKMTNHYSKFWKLLLVKIYVHDVVILQFIYVKWLGVVSWWKGEERGFEAVLA